jgi:hypothetical protein
MHPEILEIIEQRYPYEDTQSLAKELNISIHQLRRIVSKNKIKKSNLFQKEMIKKLHENKTNKYESSLQLLKPNRIQDNIIIGSLLGDGSLACYGRSKESHYREHGCKFQSNYRAWKVEMLVSLGFKFFANYKNPTIKSPSNPLFSSYHNLFYSENQKQITQEILNRFNHPLGLLCLYLDDGTLVIDRYVRKNYIHLFPRITLYTQSFTEEENKLLLKHLKTVFDVQFIMKQRKDGKGFVLQCNYRDEIIKFLKIIEYSHPFLDCMKYKMNLEYAINQKKIQYNLKYPNHEIIVDRFE